MGKNQTIAASRGSVVLCLMLATSCAGEDPDPQAIARSLFAAGAAGPDFRGLEPVVASIGAMTPWPAQPAPLGETQPVVPPPARRATFVVGQAAEHAMDEPMRDALVAAAGLASVSTPGADRDAIASLLQGRADFAIVGSALSVREQRAGLQQTRLGVELFALAVASHSPVRSLTSSQVRKVLTGEIRDWNELGHAGGAMSVYVPGDRAQAERAATVLIPGDPFGPACIRMDEDQAPRVLTAPGAIGVVRVGAGRLGQDVRLLQIDWSPATADAYAFGTYPYGVPVALVTVGQPAGAARDFLAFVRSAAGKALLGRSLMGTP